MLLEILKEDIVVGPTLAIPDSSRRFCINTDWSKYGIRAVLMQSDDSVEAINEKAPETFGVKFEFDKYLEVMFLQPVSFISKSTVSTLKNSRHSFLEDSTAVRWYIINFRQYLWVAEFTVLSYCSGLQKSFESEANVPHVLHRWRDEFLQYQLVIWHCP